MESLIQHRRSRTAVLLIPALLTALLLFGCDAEVTAVVETERPFTLYGVITPQADTQRVRVFMVDHVLRSIEDGPLDARFTSTDLETGEQRAWQDTLFREADGMISHAYWAPFKASYGHTYRLEVERSDGAMSWVEAIVPPETELTRLEPTVKYPVLLPLLLKGAVPRLLNVQVIYNVDYLYQNPAPDNAPRPDPRVPLRYDDMVEQTAEGLLVNINLSEDFRRVLLAILERSEGARVNLEYGLRLRDVTLTFIVGSEDWAPPGGVFDPDVLAQPGTLSNVENGFGFVGAGYRMTDVWAPPDEVIKAAGFTLPRDTTDTSLGAVFPR